ncbi:NUDIX domain-containing protein [Cellulomonas xiejunii]|uniref:NUDIX hydrolase n=1 Tax=Cellulomonas xiejunii TaxID=2968083 RepID=A0ABY5KM53_9CELL|nr:NUDIX hydrolase [Cellulomonas xiejunii]MCC2312911.1 NUDIX hydrolase [Cellulomonas xiejunii]MCC2320219.1 NUDIX hydrolase [Cellulomonas xiejunii]UUI70526.1 NUDIX hydrolase [Cellulomonas xiejunii]
MFRGRVTALRSDVIEMPDGGSAQRDVVELPGAVGIVALDEDDRVLLVRQYRHPVGRRLWEVPAGLLDSTTEAPREAGERELYEEGRLRARSWHTLVDVLTSPGSTDETIRILLARDLEAVPADEWFSGPDEEAELERRWCGLDEVLRGCLDGTVENGITVAAVTAVAAWRRVGGALRPADAPWLARKQEVRG